MFNNLVKNKFSIFWIIIIFIILFNYISFNFFIKNFIELEKNENYKSLVTLNTHIDSKFNTLKISATDYSQWDQTYDFIEDKKIMSPSEATISMDLADQTRKILSTLTPREEKVLRMRFGISDRVGLPVPDENLSVDAVEPEIEEQEIMEEEIPKKTKNSSRKRASK